MPIYRADIRITADIIFPSAGELVTVLFSLGKYSISLRNGPVGSDNIVTTLDATVIGPADDFETAGTHLREVLAEWLNSFAFVCQHKFMIEKVWRLLEWEPGQKTRKLRVMDVFNPNYPPRPELTSRIVETAHDVAEAALPSYVRRAMHCFRVALLQYTPEDQFMQFWTAIEVLAEGSKQKDQVPVSCPTCKSNLFCPQCSVEPTRKPMANQAIYALFTEINVPDSQEAFRKLSKVRNGISHGRGRESIEMEIKQPIPACVDLIGQIACNAIRKFIPSSIFKQEPFYRRCCSQYAIGELVVGPVGEIDQRHEGDYPSDDELPLVEIDLVLIDEHGNEAGNSN